MMNITTTQSPAPQAEIPIIQYVLISLFVFFLVVGTIGNGLVLAVVTTKRGRRSDNDIFLICLACADLVYIYFLDGMILYNTFLTTPKSIFFCKFVFPMVTVPYCAGIFTITSMAIQRGRVIMNPWRPKTRLCFINLWVLCIWIGSVLVVLPVSIVAEPFMGGCMPVWPSVVVEKAYATALFAVQYPIPLVIITVAYVRIGLYLRKPRIPRDSIIARGNRARKPRDETRSESLQIAKSLGAIVILFAVLLLPVQIAWMTWTYGKAQWVLLFWRYSDLIANAHSCFNPILYGVLTKRFRYKYREWLKRFWAGVRRGEWSNRYQDRRITPTYTRDASTMMAEKELRDAGSFTIKVPSQERVDKSIPG